MSGNFNTDLDESKMSSVHEEKSNLQLNIQTSSNNDFLIGGENHDQIVDKENYFCCFGKYFNNEITCIIPEIPNFSQNQYEYNVDVAINGKQFSNHPTIYRFYEINISSISPRISLIEGGLAMKVFF